MSEELAVVEVLTSLGVIGVLTAGAVAFGVFVDWLLCPEKKEES